MASHKQSTLSRLVDRMRLFKVKRREELKDILERRLEAIEAMSENNLTNQALQALNIDIQLSMHMDVESSIPFFKPWSHGKLAVHPINLQESKIREQLEDLRLSLAGVGPAFQSIGGGTTHRWAQIMSYRMMWELMVAPRQGSLQDRQTIGHMTDWRRVTGIPISRHFDRIFVPASPEWGIDYLWRFAEGKHPHIKVCMHHDANGTEGVPFQGELLAIMAIMVTRLGHKDFKKHVIIPVMMVSFMGNNRRGRIIVSWFDGERLIVKMSPLYRFLLQDRAGLFLFTRYLASEVDMDMTTRRLPGEA